MEQKVGQIQADIFTPIKPLNFWVQKVIPLVYDDSLSYYEVLSKVADKLNELIEIVNVQGEGIYGYIDEQMAAFRTEWAAENAAQYAAFTQKVEGDIASLSSTINSNNEIINGRITALQTSVNSQLSKQEAEMLQKISDLTAEVDSKLSGFNKLVSDTDKANRIWTTSQISLAIAKLPTDLPPVICPVDGNLESVQTCINHIWDFLNKNSITATEYDNLELTATAYDDKELTATQYDQTGKILLDPSAIQNS